MRTIWIGWMVISLFVNARQWKQFKLSTTSSSCECKCMTQMEGKISGDAVYCKLYGSPYLLSWLKCVG